MPTRLSKEHEKATQMPKLSHTSIISISIKTATVIKATKKS